MLFFAFLIVYIYIPYYIYTYIYVHYTYVYIWIGEPRFRALHRPFVFSASFLRPPFDLAGATAAGAAHGRSASPALGLLDRG